MSEEDEAFVRQRLGRLLIPSPAVPPPPAQPAARLSSPAVRPAVQEGNPGVDAATRWPARATDPDEPAQDRPLSRLPGPGAFDPGRRGVRALAAVAAVVVLAAAGWAWHSRPTAEPVPVGPAVDAADPASLAGAGKGAAPAGLGGDSPARAGPGASAGEIVVAVAGKVRRPGLVRLPPGARVADALAAVGGALPGVDVALLNLARKISDGELILVGVTAPPGVANGQHGGGGQPGVAGVPGGKVNLNTAGQAELESLPGVGPVLAQRILAHRDQRGGFRSVSDLRQVSGIGDARYEQLKDLVTV